MIKACVFGYALAFGACIAPLVTVVQAQTKFAPQPTAQAASKPRAATAPAGQVHNNGERIFAQNCSRCHNAPNGFSPSISATVVRHMRVRAQLSEHDEQELLRFFNP